MQDTNNDTPASETQPASSIPPPLPGDEKQPLSAFYQLSLFGFRLDSALNHAKSGFAKLDKEEKTGCGCGLMVLLALCFLLGKCSCSDSSNHGSSMPASPGQTVASPNKANDVTPKGQLENLMRDIFDRDFKHVELFQEDEDNIQAGVRVTVHYWIRDGLASVSPRQRHAVLRDKQTKAYSTIYHSPLPVTKAVMIGHVGLIDKYGNRSEAIGYTTVLTGDEAKKLSWKAVNEGTVDLSEVWETTFKHPDL